MEFAWDERKNRLNRRKHGVSFDLAILVFDDPFLVSRQDREVEGEARWQTIGMIRAVFKCSSWLTLWKKTTV